MQHKLVFLLSFLVAYVSALDPITLTVGGTAFVLSGAQVGLGVGVLAALAIAKEKLIIAELYRRNRGKRSVADETPNFEAMFDALYQVDTDDCSKLLVCHVFEKPEDSLNAAERRIKSLFSDDKDKVDSSSSKGEYQLASFVGSLNQTGLCSHRYSRCFVPADSLSTIAGN